MTTFTYAGSSYFLSRKKQLCSDVNEPLIISESECRRAASNLNLQIQESFSWTGSWSIFPKGCALDDNTYAPKVYFNTHSVGGVGSSLNRHARQICKASGMIKSIIERLCKLN